MFQACAATPGSWGARLRRRRTPKLCVGEDDGTRGIESFQSPQRDGTVVIDLDEIIIGQGLAGTTLAWQLLDRQRRVLVVDRAETGTSSRLAAGLITPITGQRLTVSWRCREFLDNAVDFYQQIEARTQATLLHRQGAVRFWQNDREPQVFVRRWREEPDFAALVSELRAIPEGVIAGLDGFVMPAAARLDVPRYLDVSRDEFQRRDVYCAADIDPAADLVVSADGVRIPRLDVRARTVVFCQGIAAADNPWFRSVEFDATRGEILTVRIPHFDERRTLHRGIWLASLGDGLFRLGATSRWDDLTEGPTEAERDWLCSRLREWLRCDFEIVGHDAGVRPIVKGRHPLLGRHPTHSQLAYFNGLGSKGSLQAPAMAAQLVTHLVDGTPLDPDVDLHLRTVGWP